MSKDAIETLGTILEPGPRRDAVHVAVIAAVAGDDFYAGDHVRLNKGLALHGYPRVGIVDPFLTDKVEKGKTFWIFIYPKKITSLRHVWTHPSIPDETPLPSKPPKEESEKWLREFCARTDCPDYETTIAAASDGITWPLHAFTTSIDHRNPGVADARGKILVEIIWLTDVGLAQSREIIRLANLGHETELQKIEIPSPPKPESKKPHFGDGRQRWQNESLFDNKCYYIKHNGLPYVVSSGGSFKSTKFDSIESLLSYPDTKPYTGVVYDHEPTPSPAPSPAPVEPVKRKGT